ncbi:MAG TPA: PEP-CTERM sorting domain-containing protein [Roseateles sp.]
MKFKFVVSLAVALFALCAQAAVIGDTAALSPAIGRSGGDTFAAQAEKSRVDSSAQADDSVALPEPDVALLVAGIGVIGFLAARRRNR